MVRLVQAARAHAHVLMDTHTHTLSHTRTHTHKYSLTHKHLRSHARLRALNYARTGFDSVMTAGRPIGKSSLGQVVLNLRSNAYL